MTVRLPRPLLLGPRSAVTAAHPLAVAAGTELLEAGGNAVDAAVAAAAALAVVLPDACGLGGDSLTLVRERGADPVAYLGAAATPRRAILPVPTYGPGAAGVPGAVAGWCALHERHGRLPLERVLAPSVALAADGFPVSAGLVEVLARRRARLEEHAAGWVGLSAQPGATLRQPELAATLERVAGSGAAGFYAGPVAAAIAAAVRAPDGAGIDLDDLAAYGVAPQAPVGCRYTRARVTFAPAPSQAALAALALQALEGAPAPGTAAGEHASIEAIKAAFERRAVVTGADAAAALAAPLPAPGEQASALRGATSADHTAAVAAADADGLVVSMLVSVFHEFGSGVLVPEGGFFLNNRLSGLLIGGASPAAAPPGGTRPGHTLSPMLLELDDRVLAIATPGADGQVQTLVQLTRLLVDAGAEIPQALHAARWRSVAGELALEASFDADVAAGLVERGHTTTMYPDGDPLFGSAAIAGTDEATGAVLAASDPRREVWAAVR